MESFRRWLHAAKDPLLVWNFQKTFGVEKVRVQNKGDADDPYVAVDYDEWVAAGREEEEEAKLAHKRKLSISSSGYSTGVFDEASNGEDGAHAQRLASAMGASSNSSTSSPQASSSASSSPSSSRKDGRPATDNLVFYRVTSWFWHWVFHMGTKLGDETYYSIFFTIWFWNIDGAVGRRVMMVWCLVMYIGQGMKDVIRWPRPAMPPVVHLEQKWIQEYGMPSTHSMVGLAVPSSILFFTYGRYLHEPPFFWWVLICLVWVTLVSISRIYLGVHSFADIYMGLAVGLMLLVPVLPLAEYSDFWLLSSPYAPFVLTAIELLGLYFYPGSDRWTPARGDTVIIMGAYLGVRLGAWANYHLGYLTGPPLEMPYPILWPEFNQYGQPLLRFAIGSVMAVATHAVMKPLTYFIACWWMGVDMKKVMAQKKDIRNKHKLRAELTYKFVAWGFVGFVVQFVAPVAFSVIGCQRSTFHTEV